MLSHSLCCEVMPFDKARLVSPTSGYKGSEACSRQRGAPFLDELLRMDHVLSLVVRLLIHRDCIARAWMVHLFVTE